jgi:hypothetical protein
MEMTMMITNDDVVSRKVVWEMAQEMVLPLIEDHGLKEYTIGQEFRTSVVTKVDQNLEHIERVANWLLNEEQ